MEEVRTKIGDAGGLFLPAEYQEFLGIKPGDEVILKPISGEIRIVPVRQAIQRARELVRKYVPTGSRLAEALIQDRREEAERE